MLGRDWTSIDRGSFGRVMSLKENIGLLSGISSVDRKTKGVLVLRILKSRTDDIPFCKSVFSFKIITLLKETRSIKVQSFPNTNWDLKER